MELLPARAVMSVFVFEPSFLSYKNIGKGSAAGGAAGRGGGTIESLFSHGGGGDAGGKGTAGLDNP
jgi:hypothetical protein